MARERRDHVLQTTALINEAFVRLIDWRNVRWQNQAHFFAVSAQLMRRILVDFARSQNCVKRGGAALRGPLEEAFRVSEEHSADLVDLDEALTRLASLHTRQSQVVELKFFGDLEMEEIAEVLGVSSGTVKRDWRVAKLWLLRELRGLEGKESDDA
jgi:RNA polymerase sigma factor (TIGR02999 family)